MKSIVTIAIAGLLCYFIFRCINTSAEAIRTADNRLQMRMHAAYMYFGYCCLMICAGIVGGVLYDYSKIDAPAAILAITIFILFGILGIYNLKLYYVHTVLYNKHHITCYNTWGKAKVFHWKDIRHAVYNGYTGSIRLYSSRKEHIIIHHDLGGIDDFYREFYRQKPRIAQKVKIRVLT
ncbi:MULTISPECIES: DUF6560 family protein [unclassified Sphingobacterium]|uniref:DUF6560 family protein n=1 Tax=unclassified Sphingobacterium TaxID=2609468 RepID=UPI0025E59706|nr:MULTISPECIES: DUF6560 family protein [unclassified Sphingobacterium]